MPPKLTVLYMMGCGDVGCVSAAWDVNLCVIHIFPCIAGTLVVFPNHTMG